MALSTLFQAIRIQSDFWRTSRTACRWLRSVRLFTVALGLRHSYGPIMRTTMICIAFSIALICAAPLGTARADEIQYPKIRAGMSKLAPLVGKWRAAAKFYDSDGVTEEVGAYSISSVLDDTYLQWEVELHHKENPKRSHSFIIYVTFNPMSNQYDSTYFYSRWALRVTETGEYDDATQEFRTKAFIPLEDGVHDENVRTTTSLKDPDKIVYKHYSRYSHEQAERLNLEITLTRITK
jgi:hypothetical protein